MNKTILSIIILLMLSFGLNTQSLAQNVNIDNSGPKIKITADSTQVPEYLSKSKQAKTKKTKKEDTKKSFADIIFSMAKALFLAVGLFLAVIAVVFKNKDKFTKNPQPVSLKKATETETQEPPAQNEQEAPKPELDINNPERKIRYLVFKFFKMNK